MFTIIENINLPVIEGSYSTKLNIKSLKGWSLIPTSVFNYFPLTFQDILQDKDFFIHFPNSNLEQQPKLI